MIRLLVALTLLLALLVAASLAFGDVPLTFRELYSAITGTGDPDPQSTMIVLGLRLPRVLLALLVGTALATAGTITLAIMRNPLAEPGVLGINSGAAAAAMAVIVLVRDPPVALLQAAGFFGAAAMMSGAQFGASSCQPLVSIFSLAPVGLITPMPMPAPFQRANAIRSPSGLQTGAELAPPPKLMRRWPEPSASIT